MRITGGTWRGRRLPDLKGFQGRPTTDFGREGLFNLLSSRVDVVDAQVLDLFSGTGMVALEFLSRGAASVTSVERRPVPAGSQWTKPTNWAAINCMPFAETFGVLWAKP